MAGKNPARGGVVQFTARVPEDVHRRLRFLAADAGESVNETFNKLLLEAMANHHISVPNGLLSLE